MVKINISQSQEDVGDGIDFQSLISTSTEKITPYLQIWAAPTIFLQYVPYPLKDQEGVSNQSLIILIILPIV